MLKDLVTILQLHEITILILIAIIFILEIKYLHYKKLYYRELEKNKQIRLMEIIASRDRE